LERFHCVELHAPLKRQGGASKATEKEKDKEADLIVFEHCGNSAQLQLKKRDATSPAIDPSIKQFRKVASLEEAQVRSHPQSYLTLLTVLFYEGNICLSMPRATRYRTEEDSGPLTKYRVTGTVSR